MAKKNAKAKPKAKATVRVKVRRARPAPKKSPLEGVKPTFKIENIVASANLGVELDLYEIAQEVKDVEYEPEQFPGAILKFKEPKASLLLFKNGKVICAGAKNEKEIKIVLAKAKKLLKPYAEKGSK